MHDPDHTNDTIHTVSKSCHRLRFARNQKRVDTLQWHSTEGAFSTTTEPIATKVLQESRRNMHGFVSGQLAQTHLEVRWSKFNFTVNTTRAHERRVKCVWPICGHDDFDVAPSVKPIQLRHGKEMGVIAPWSQYRGSGRAQH